MGMYWCKDCELETPSAQCKFCGGTNTYKYWWTFAAKPGHSHGTKVFYNEDGTVDREVTLGG